MRRGAEVCLGVGCPVGGRDGRHGRAGCGPAECGVRRGGRRGSAACHLARRRTARAAFSLTDQGGARLSLARLRGRPVIVTFIDPLCRNYCPREASVLSTAVERFRSARPVIVAVSVDPWGDSRQNFREDAAHWRLAPGWIWGVGTESQLATVWRRYQIAVELTTKTVAGIRVHEITHTSAAYLIDRMGYERALLLYPFDAGEVVAALRGMLAPSRPG